MIGDPPGGTMADAPAGARDAAAPARVGKYRLDRVIGAGGMGIVWAAFDPDLERAVAIKLLRVADGGPTMRARLLREARAMARLKHPNVVTVYEVGTDDARDYIAMELVDGESLDVWLASRPPRDQVMAALLDAGQGLAAAHEAGLVHRDFKPHNVLRSRSGHVYVTDFGLARGSVEEGVPLERASVPALPDDLASGLRRPLDSLLDSPLTQTGALIGTPAYMAAEQLAGRAPDARSDQFAFCVTAWEALTGNRPFGGSTLVELASAAAGDPPAASDLPPAIRAVLLRGLAAAPEARWPDLPSLLAALAEAAAGRPRRRRSRRFWLPLAAVVVAVAVSAAASIALTALRSRGSRPAAEDGCDSPAEAFAGAWSPARRARVSRAHAGGDAIGAIVLLDGIRDEWLRSYADACADPPGPARSEQLNCLARVRDDVAEITAAIAEPHSATAMGDLGLLTVAVSRCDPDGPSDLPRPPGPRPPVPPVPPRP